MIIVECALNERKNDCYYLQAGNRRRRRRLGLWCLQLGSHTPGGLQSGWSGKRELGLTNSPDNRALFSCFSDSRTRFYTLQNPHPPPPAPTPLRSATEREPIMPMVQGVCRRRLVELYSEWVRWEQVKPGRQAADDDDMEQNSKTLYTIVARSTSTVENNRPLVEFVE